MAKLVSKKEIVNYKGQKKLVSFNVEALDPKKLRKLLAENHINMAAASVNCGYAASSLSSMCSEGYIPMPMMIALESKYGLKPADYLFKPEPSQEEAKAEEPKQEENIQSKAVLPPIPVEESDLYKAMKAAMLDALNECVAGNMKNIRGMIYTAVSQALQAK